MNGMLKGLSNGRVKSVMIVLPWLWVSLLALPACNAKRVLVQEAQEIPPEIRSALQEDLKEAPTDPLAQSYDPLSLLQKAESAYRQERYIEAASEYEYFLSLHPLNRWAAYAQYKLGLSYFHQIQTVDRDPEPVHKALAAFQKLVDLYPNSAFQELALEKIRICRERLAEHEFYVGEFYYKKGAYEAAIHRFTGILEKYPQTEAAGKALYYLALTNRQQGDTDQARKRLQELLEKYPKTEYHQEAIRLLSRLNGKST